MGMKCVTGGNVAQLYHYITLVLLINWTYIIHSTSASSVASTALVLALVGIGLALSLTGKATLVGCAEGPLLTGVGKVTILLGDGLRCIGKLVGDVVGGLVEVSNAVGSTLSSRRVLHVVVRKALGLGSDTTLGGLAERALLAGVCEVGFLLCH